MPDPASIGAKTVRVRTASSEVSIVEHMALDRPTHCVNALADVGDLAVDMRTVRMPSDIACRWLAIVAITSSRLSVNITTCKHRNACEACERESSNHEDRLQ